MWAAVSACVIGTSHLACNLPCQDACHVVRFRVQNEELLLCAIADGAGSASHSQIGSKEAVNHLLKLVAREDLDIAQVDAVQVKAWFKDVLQHLSSVACRENVDVRELACTMLLAIVSRSTAVFGQIGDGAWVLEKDGELLSATWPETGEFANVTIFLTTSDSLDRIQFNKVEGQISGLAGFTDGIQCVTLNYSEHKPHAPFFNAMLAPLRNAQDETELIAPLQQLLASTTFTDRTDDDKTLVLASWREITPQPAPNGPAE